MAALDWLIEQIKWLIGLADPDNLKALVNLGGPWWVSYLVLTAVVFSETGLLIGFFLPGDSMLFAAGFLASQNVFNYWLLNLCLCTAAILGDAVNYYFGRKTTEQVFEKGHFRFIKQDHLLAAREFYERHGGMAIILARFAPFVRTFTPYVAGIARMDYRQFAFYNIIGGITWVLSMTTAGFWLGQIPWVQDNFEKVVLTIVFVSVLPVLIGAGKTWLQSRARAESRETRVES
ncbi:MAG: VTT domain-containing protein [Planctomycetaceae bacterium]|nr:VTT domain-containing protein [Planctomycetaceae bacterium]